MKEDLIGIIQIMRMKSFDVLIIMAEVIKTAQSSGKVLLLIGIIIQ